MFWRRRKLPEEDQPLVPYGLISQAMASEGSPELPPDMLDSPKDVTQSPAEPVEMRLRVTAPAQTSETAPLPEQGKISPPLKWPRVDEAEIARRAQGIDTAVSFPYRKPIVSAAVPELDEFEPEPEIAEAPKLEVVEVQPTIAPLPGARTEKLRNLLSRARDFRLPNPEPLQQRIDSVFSRARTSAAGGLHAATEQLQEVRNKSAIAFHAAKLELVNRSHAALSQSRSGLRHVEENMRRVDFSGATGAWNRLRSLQIKVRIPASNQRFIASLLEWARGSRRRTQEILRRDSRLWASMGMAALSALLALGFISAIRQYGAERVQAQPTSTAASPVAAPAKIVQSNAIVAPNASPAAAPIAPKSSPIANVHPTKQRALATPAAVIVPQKVVSAASIQKHRAHHNTEEDDYVAKDTYVFYGNSGKPSR